MPWRKLSLSSVLGAHFCFLCFSLSLLTGITPWPLDYIYPELPF